MAKNRVVLVPCPLPGHLNPMLELGTLLHSKGFSVTVAYVTFNPLDKSNYPDFTFIPLEADVSKVDTSVLYALALVNTINNQCEAQLQKCLADMESEPHDRVVCVIYDTLMHYAESVSNMMNIPTIVLHTTSASALLAYFAIPQLVEDGLIPLKDSMLDDIVPGLNHLRFKDMPIQNTEEGLLKMISIVSNVNSSSAIIWNTVEHLESSSLTQLNNQYYNQLPFFQLGPLHKMAPLSITNAGEKDVIVKSWLDKQAPNSVIYVSFGSLAYMTQNELTEMAWGLANSGQFVLWVVRPGSIYESEWVELLPEGFREAVGDRICITKWSDQKDTLAHSAVGGFWSHCGWNSTLESISEGVPMICRPFSGDQFVNSRYLTNVWSVGIEFKDALERGKIEKTIRTLMVDNEGVEMRRKANNMKEKIRICTMEGGSSSDSLVKLVDFILSFKLTT